MIYEREAFKKIVESNTVLIYGAGVCASQVGTCLMDDPYNVRVAAFVVTNAARNPRTLLKRPVITLDVAKQIFDRDTLIIVACVEKNKEGIEEILNTTNYRNILFLTFESDLWSGIRGNYLRGKLDKAGYKYRILAEELRDLSKESQYKEGGLEESLEDIPNLANGKPAKTLEVYRAVSKFDKPIFAPINEFGWEKEIYVGAALSDDVWCEIRDDKGDNISFENRRYCELTALYYMWKNCEADFLGLCHYRRHFDLGNEDREKILNSDIDVILTIPIVNYPNVYEAYARDHYEEDWRIMKKAIIILYPDYLFDLVNMERGIFYFAYNMFIARKEIFDKYCKWLFDILEFCDKQCKHKNDAYQNRYLGFLGERLLTVFMLHHFDDYKIVIANKHFVE